MYYRSIIYNFVIGTFGLWHTITVLLLVILFANWSESVFFYILVLLIQYPMFKDINFWISPQISHLRHKTVHSAPFLPSQFMYHPSLLSVEMSHWPQIFYQNGLGFHHKYSWFEMGGYYLLHFAEKSNVLVDFSSSFIYFDRPLDYTYINMFLDLNFTSPLFLNRLPVDPLLFGR